MKTKGFLLMDVIVSIFIFLVIILNLLIILNKNFESVKKLVLNQEILRIVNNIENVMERDLNEKREEKSYCIIDHKNKLTLKNMKNNREEEVGKFKYISKDNIKNIKIIGKNVILNNERIGKIFFFVIEIDEQHIENIIEE